MDAIRLMNFNVPLTTRKRFDAICHANGRTRTSVLVELMTKHVLEEGRRLIERREALGDLDKLFQDSPGLTGSNGGLDRPHRTVPSPWQTQVSRESDLPSSFYSDGREEW